MDVRKTDPTVRQKARMERLKTHHDKCLATYNNWMKHQAQVKQRKSVKSNTQKTVTGTKARRAARKSKVAKVKPVLKAAEVLQGTSQDVKGSPASQDTEEPDVPPLERTDSIFNLQDAEGNPQFLDTEKPDVPCLERTKGISVKESVKSNTQKTVTGTKARRAARKSKVAKVKPVLKAAEVLQGTSQDVKGSPASWDTEEPDVPPLERTDSIFNLQDAEGNPQFLDTEKPDVPCLERTKGISVKESVKSNTQKTVTGTKARRAARKSKVAKVKPVLKAAEVLQSTSQDVKGSPASWDTEEPDVPPLERTDSIFNLQDAEGNPQFLDTEEPDVPFLERTKGISLTEKHPDSNDVVPDSEEESSLGWSEGSGSEYSPSKHSLRERSTEDSYSTDHNAVQNKMIFKKSPKNYRRKKYCSIAQEGTSDSEDNAGPDQPTNQKLPVSVMKLKKKQDGTRVYSKRHYCMYCSITCHKMARHLTRRHSKEKDVAKALSFPLKSKDRKLNFDMIRNHGDRTHNMEVMKKGSGTLVPSKLTDEPVKASDYMHCINCAALLKRKSLWRHMSRCRFSQKTTTNKPGKSRIQSLCSFAQPVPDGVSRKVWELVNCMHQDEVTTLIRQEKGILRLGEHLYLKHGHDTTKHEYIRQKMREVGRLIRQAQKAGKLHKIEDFFVPSNFNFVIEAVREVAGFIEDKNIYKTPSLALKLGHSLKKIADILECDAKMDDCENEQFLKNLQRSRMLYEKKWDVCVSSRALQTLKEAKWNTPQLLPFTEDVRAMHVHIDTYRREYQHDLKNEPNKKNWSKLATLTLCEVILFNRKREGEVSKMPLSSFTLKNETGIHSDLATGLSELEQKLCQHFLRIEIKGKRNRKVPILLTPEMVASMEILVEHRQACSISSDNPFFFSRPEAVTHLRGSDAIRQMAKECGAKHPETLSSTKLRKHVSTLSTVLNLKDNEMDILANFLGHDIRVHREYYRLPEGTLELAKVSKILLALEQGRISDFKGMSLDQIQIDPNEVVLDVGDSDLSETEAGLETSMPSSLDSSIPQRQRQSVSPDGDQQTAHNKRKEFDSDSESDKGSSLKKRRYDQETLHPNNDTQTKPMRKGWSAAEVRAVEKTLMAFIESGKVPGKFDCVACINASPEALKNRSWSGVKFYVKNRITAIQRESAKRMR